MRAVIHARCSALLLTALLAACASTGTSVPYPAFIQVDELPDVFLAGMPGVRAKQLAGNPHTGRSSNRILLPADWQFTTGASPNTSVELFVLAGQIELGDLTLRPGGYAYVPPGSTGLSMRTEHGAMLLYFLDDANPAALIQTPLITSSDLIEWQPVAGYRHSYIKELRFDPGSGARTWLHKVAAGGTTGWFNQSALTEGYLVAGKTAHSECINGETIGGRYASGGYFLRPAGAIHSEEQASEDGDAVWLYRSLERYAAERVEGCTNRD